MSETDSHDAQRSPKVAMIAGGCALSLLGLATMLAGIAVFSNDYFLGDKANPLVTWGGAAGVVIGLLIFALGALRR